MHAHPCVLLIFFLFVCLLVGLFVCLFVFVFVFVLFLFFFGGGRVGGGGGFNCCSQSVHTFLIFVPQVELFGSPEWRDCRVCNYLAFE